MYRVNIEPHGDGKASKFCHYIIIIGKNIRVTALHSSSGKCIISLISSHKEIVQIFNIMVSFGSKLVHFDQFYQLFLHQNKKEIKAEIGPP